MIRKATLRDLDQLVPLFSKYFKEEDASAPVGVWDHKTDLANVKNHVKFFLRSRKKFVFLYEEDGKIGGFLVGSFVKQKKILLIDLMAYIEHLYVIPTKRGKGISSLLKDEFVKLSKEKNAKALFLEVGTKNSASKIYEGWGLKKEYIIMVKKL